MSDSVGTDSIPGLDENLGDDIVREILQSGTDLRAYSQDVEKELRQLETESIGDYIKESPNIASLHSEINGCDKILERLEDILCTFQADLGNICQEILSLQEESVSLNIRLKNKQAVRSDLSQFVDDIIIPENVVSHILETQPSEREFLEQLMVLDQKIALVKEQAYREALSCQDIMEILHNLKIRAVVKIREYVLKKISSCRKAMTNYQIPQNALLKNKFYYKFLVTHDPEVGREILLEYAETMSKVYFSYFKEYFARLLKLKYDEQPDRDDLMAADDSVKTRGSLFSSRPSIKNRGTIFTLGDRANLLTSDLEAPLLVPHAALKSDARYPTESLFRSHQYALVDNACREYVFVSEFFILSAKQAQDKFDFILGRTLSHFLKSLEDEFTASYDAIGLFLCLQIIYRYRLMGHKRAVPALDFYWDTLVKIIWPRFESIFQSHIHSVRSCDPLKLSSCDTRPHYITRRYAEFSAAIVAINDTFPDDRVSILLSGLQTEVENFILKMAARFSTPKEQLIFIINNYDMILGVLLERTKDDSKESESIKQQLTKRVHDFVEELLYPHFGHMMSFVKDCEAYLERQDGDLLSKEEKKVTSLVKGFNGTWRKAIEDINREVMTCFTNFKCGNNIQQTALTQIIQYYHRFHKIVSQAPFKNNPIRSELINIHQLMVEIKKYKSNF
ncbi:Vacuolar protein sorting-associated protein 52 -like protein [Halotydeus destructor]|nr:Vacuolar protein sorting-associated protein 52 -like protein [Halotydeus destructor]